MFDPYISKQWAVSGNILGGLRLLILGESHYSSDTNCARKQPGATKDVVREFINGERRRFFTRADAGRRREASVDDDTAGDRGGMGFGGLLQKLCSGLCGG